MISYEATLVCDKCLAMMPGDSSSNAQKARQSALEYGRLRGWIQVATTNGIGTGILCPKCKKGTNEPTPQAVPNVPV